MRAKEFLVTPPTRTADRPARRANWAARLRRSRRTGPGPAADRRADHGLWTVDRVIRVLATACDRENRPVPVAHVVVVGAESVRFHLRTPDQRPPAGWTADQDGRVWQAPLRRLQSAGVAESLADPYPRLVPLGRTSEGFVLLNLGQAGGLIGLEGDARTARALAQDWAHELATSPWSRDVRVVKVGFKSAAEAGGSAGPEATPEGVPEEPADAAAELDEGPGGVLVLAAPPGGRDRERYQRLADEAGGRWAVVVVGRTDQPRWRFTVDAAGYVDTGLLDERVAHHPDAPVEPPPVPVEAAATPDATVGGRTARTGRAVTRRRAVVAGIVAAVCLGGAGMGIALGTSGSSSEPVAHAAGTTAAGTGTGTPSAAGTADSPSAQAPSATAPTTVVGAPPASVPSSGQPSAGKGTGTAGGSGKTPGAPFKNPASGKCLSATAGTDGTPLVLAACDGSDVQRWHIAPDGTIQVKGLCMDAAWGATTPGTVVQVANCSGNVAQKFAMRGDTVYSKNASLCVSVLGGGTGIRLEPCGSGGPQTFKRR
ncbi:RICIN domain-containing protein [Actinacidiphila alni]|uniref:RICIN domain-containing protein n=1 Tax=Actinacidiphila alni TaxID=380248 RepID=UPI003410D251